jgi:hypothetical protein
MKEQVLRGCPHCGSKPVFKGYVTPCSPPYGDAEYTAEIYCNNYECKQLYQDDIVEHWNTRAYDAELEELRKVKREYEYIIGRINNKLHGLKSADYLKDSKEIQEKLTLLNEILNYV